MINNINAILPFCSQENHTLWTAMHNLWLVLKAWNSMWKLIESTLHYGAPEALP